MTNEMGDGSESGATIQMNPALRFINIFISPRETFESLKGSKWAWIVPVILVFLVGMAVYPIIKDIVIEDQVYRLENNKWMQNLPESQRQEIIENTRESMESPPPWQYGIGIVWTAAMALIGAAVLLLIASVILGGEARFWDMVNVYAFSALVGIPETLVKTFLIKMKGTTDVRTSLAILLPSDENMSFLYFFLNKIDIFSIWMLALLVIGINVHVPNVSKNKIAIWVVAFWLIWVLLISTFSVFSGGSFGL